MSSTVTIDEQFEYLKKGAVEVIREEELKSKLAKAAATANRCESKRVLIQPHPICISATRYSFES
jgi:hypothetical protein